MSNIDLENNDRITLTSTYGFYGKLQDQIWIGQSNKYITRIIKYIDRFSIEIKTYVRPSRGFAKHNRRIKQYNKS